MGKLRRQAVGKALDIARKCVLCVQFIHTVIACNDDQRGCLCRAPRKETDNGGCRGLLSAVRMAISPHVEYDPLPIGTRPLNAVQRIGIQVLRLLRRHGLAHEHRLLSEEAECICEYLPIGTILFRADEQKEVAVPVRKHPQQESEVSPKDRLWIRNACILKEKGIVVFPPRYTAVCHHQDEIGGHIARDIVFLGKHTQEVGIKRSCQTLFLQRSQARKSVLRKNTVCIKVMCKPRLPPLRRFLGKGAALEFKHVRKCRHRIEFLRRIVKDIAAFCPVLPPCEHEGNLGADVFEPLGKDTVQRGKLRLCRRQLLRRSAFDVRTRTPYDFQICLPIHFHYAPHFFQSLLSVRTGAAFSSESLFS